MTGHVRRAAAFCLLLLLALLVNACPGAGGAGGGRLHANPANRRTAIARFGQPRGEITVAASAVTGSRDSGEQLRYERTYADGALYAPVTGFASQTYGTTMLESAEDGVLVGRPTAARPAPAVDDAAPAPGAGGTVVTTIDARPCSGRPTAGSPGARARWPRVEPSTGRILALVRRRRTTPGCCPATARHRDRAWRG